MKGMFVNERRACIGARIEIEESARQCDREFDIEGTWEGGILCVVKVH